MAQEHTYIAIDLKSFYASAECAAHGLDPLNANLVVADASRTDKTICLAVSPALKSFAVPGRPRRFEVNQQVDRVNRQRAAKFANRRLAKTRSIYKDELERRTGLRVDFMIVPPRMRYYLQVSAKIYEIYLRFIPPEKIHVYSIDEVFIDATDYLATHHESAHALAKKMIQAIQAEFGITATAGIGTNLYLAKVAMDIVAKKIPGDVDGVRIVAMTEQDYRRLLWAHQPLTDFWRIGRGYARRLEKLGLHTMGDIARCSLGTLSDPQNEEVLYREFGKHAQLLINHAWGYEAATIEDIKNYRASEHGIYSGQVLMKPYTIPQARQVISEMSADLSLQLVKRHALTNQIALLLSYDVKSISYASNYHGPIVTDFYGRQVPKPDHGGANLPDLTSSPRELRGAFLDLYDRIANWDLLIRKVTVIANHLVDEEEAAKQVRTEQLNLFEDPHQKVAEQQSAQSTRDQEHEVQELVLKLQEQYGKNAIIRAADLLDGSTTRKRNDEIGGHKA